MVCYSVTVFCVNVEYNVNHVLDNSFQILSFDMTAATCFTQTQRLVQVSVFCFFFLYFLC